MPSIAIVAFRGLGWINQLHPTEPGLIYVGHVGLKGVIADKIIGFSPTPQAIQSAGGEANLLKLLIKREVQPGCLQDDTAVFHRAHELGIVVWELSVDVLPEVIDQIKEWYNYQKESLYNFPARDGSFPEGHANCATFPALLGVPLPYDTGQMRAVLTQIMKMGATKWSR